jgi:hypothetical protein
VKFQEPSLEFGGVNLGALVDSRIQALNTKPALWVRYAIPVAQLPNGQVFDKEYSSFVKRNQFRLYTEAACPKRHPSRFFRSPFSGKSFESRDLVFSSIVDGKGHNVRPRGHRDKLLAVEHVGHR